MIAHESSGLQALNASSNQLYKYFFELVKKGEVDEIVKQVNQSCLDVANLYNDLSFQ